MSKCCGWCFRMRTILQILERELHVLACNVCTEMGGRIFQYVRVGQWTLSSQLRLPLWRSPHSGAGSLRFCLHFQLFQEHEDTEHGKPSSPGPDLAVPHHLGARRPAGVGGRGGGAPAANIRGTGGGITPQLIHQMLTVDASTF